MESRSRLSLLEGDLRQIHLNPVAIEPESIYRVVVRTSQGDSPSGIAAGHMTGTQVLDFADPDVRVSEREGEDLVIRCGDGKAFAGR